MEKELREIYQKKAFPKTDNELYELMHSAYQLGIQKERKEWQEAFKSLEKFANEHSNVLNPKT